MKIELRGVQIYDRMSEETTAFTASIYIDGKRIGWAKNEGHGGPTSYGPDDYKDQPIIKMAEDFCEGLPPLKIKDTWEGDGTFELPMNLEHYIDELLFKAAEEKEKKRYQKLIEKHQKDALCIGNDDTYFRIKWKYSIDELLKHEMGRDAIKNTVAREKAKMKKGDRILNTNIPKELL